MGKRASVVEREERITRKGREKGEEGKDKGRRRNRRRVGRWGVN